MDNDEEHNNYIKRKDVATEFEMEVYEEHYISDAVKELYASNKESLNWMIRKGKTALMISAERRNIETLKFLLAMGADPNISSSDDGLPVTALTLAMQKNLTLTVRELVQYGAHFSCENGIEALELVASKCFFQELIAGEEKLFSGYISSKPIKTAIAVAFENGRQSLLTKLINCGLSLERTLLLDSTTNQPGLVKLLIDNRVNVKVASPSLDTALHKAAQNNNIQSIKLLIQAQSNIDAENQNGETPLHKALSVFSTEESCVAELQNLEIIRFLIESKASVNFKDKKGNSSLHKAVQYGKTEVVKLLIEKKADANAINKNNETVLHKSADVGNKETVTLLTGLVLNINNPDMNGDTALHRAARRKNFDAVELLVSAQVNINAINKTGETALHIASALAGSYPQFNMHNLASDSVIVTIQELRSAKCYALAIVQYLIDAGADINLEDINGKTPLSIAVDKENLILAHILLKGNADVNKMYVKNLPSPVKLSLDIDFLGESFQDLDVCECGNLSCTTFLDFKRYFNQTKSLLKLKESLLWLTLSRKCQLTPMAKLLIHYGADVNIPNEDNKTLLMLAVEQLDVDLVEAVIAAGADVNAKDNFGKSVLIRGLRIAIGVIANHENSNRLRSYFHPNVEGAVEKSQEILRHLLKAGCSINSQNGMHAMVLAVNGGHGSILKLLLEYGGNVDARDYESNTLTMLALRNNSLDIFEILMAAGADVINVVNKFGDSTLHFVAKCKKSKIVQSIIDKIVHAKEKSKVQVERKRCKCIHEKTLNLDVLNKRSETPLYKAAANGRRRNVKLLLKYGASVNIQSKNGNTALMAALKHCFKNVVKILLSAKADVNILNKKGENSLLVAAKSGCTETVKLLIKYGADPHLSTCVGSTGLSLAANKDIADIFLKAGADVNLRNVYGQTPLHCAVKGGKEDVLKFLLDHGANVDMKDCNGNTPLIIAERAAQRSVIFSLLDAKANVNLQNKKGKTALILLCENITKEMTMPANMLSMIVLDHLLKSGADVNLKDNIGRTAVMYTCMDSALSGHSKLINHGANLEAEDYLGRTILVQALMAHGVKWKALAILKLGVNPVLKVKYRNILIQQLPDLRICDEKNEFLRLLVCNGIVNMACFKSYFPVVHDTYVELCLSRGSYNLLRYILANCYISNQDLSYIRLKHPPSSMCSKPSTYTTSRTPGQKEMDELIERSASQPWPLFNLSFIAASTMMGESPEREVRIGNSQLPNPLKDKLLFQTNVARTTVREWSTLPLCFEANILSQ